MKELRNVLFETIGIADELNCDYAIMGGIAVRMYGIPRATFDVDITLSITRSKLNSFFDMAESRGFTILDAYRRGWVDRVGEMPLVKLRYYLQDQGLDVDVFLVETKFQGSVIQRRKLERMEGDASAWFVSPEDLILMKLIANRPRDQGDVQDIFFMQGELDMNYLKQWSDWLEVRSRLEKALSDVNR